MCFILADNSCCLQKQIKIKLQVKRLFSLGVVDDTLCLVILRFPPKMRTNLFCITRVDWNNNNDLDDEYQSPLKLRGLLKPLTLSYQYGIEGLP